MKTIAVLLFSSTIFVIQAHAQVTFNVTRSEVLQGQTYQLPSFPWSGPAQGVANDPGYSAYTASVSSGTPAVEIVSVTGTGMPGGWPPAYASGTVTPTVRIPTNAPAVFTNIIFGTGQHFDYGTGYGYGPPGGLQTFIFTIVDDTLPPASQHYAFLIGKGDTLESISRKETSSAPRKLIGFQIEATTNAIMDSLIFVLSNTSTNANPIENLAFVLDADGLGEFDSSDTILATTTNASGLAIFSGMNIAVSTNGPTYFLTGTFQPTNQTQNSFIATSLNPRNIQTTPAGTNALIMVMGGTVLGKQYAFLDTTLEEDAAAALSVSNQINGAVNSATNSLGAAFNSQLATTTNDLTGAFNSQVNGLSTQIGDLSSQLASVSNSINSTRSVSDSGKADLLDSVLPAAAAGAAAVGAAFTSDSLKQTPTSRDYSPRP